VEAVVQYLTTRQLVPSATYTGVGTDQSARILVDTDLRVRVSTGAQLNDAVPEFDPAPVAVRTDQGLAALHTIDADELDALALVHLADVREHHEGLVRDVCKCLFRLSENQVIRFLG